MYGINAPNSHRARRVLRTKLVRCSLSVLQVKVLPLFKNQAKFEPKVGNQILDMENILVYYVDEEGPTFTMKNLSGGIIAVIVVVVLAVVIGLVALVSMLNIVLCVGASSALANPINFLFSPQFFLNKRGKKRYNKTQVRPVCSSHLACDKS